MTFWNWFQTNGARVFAFIAAASLVLKTMSWMPPWAANSAEALGVLATVAHHIFFPSINPMTGQNGPKA